MATVATESENQGFATEMVPESAQGSGWRIFFIVAGSLCGLPVFILSARIFGSLGFLKGLEAVVIGAIISAALGACTAYTGSRARKGLALLADEAFGSWGARIVKLVIAISLVGWFGVNIGVLGATAAHALTSMSGVAVQPLAIGLPVCIAIAGITIFGASGLEKLGTVLVPITLAVLLTSVWLVAPRLSALWTSPGSGALTFGQAVSAIVGSYIVGIVIQPDYGRFVRRPRSAAAGAAASLGLVFPLILTLSSMASMTMKTPELISAMILLGFGLPALTVLLLGAWIDASACLYSASLSLVNQLPRLPMRGVIVAITLIGIVLVLVGADTAFIPFLVALGVSLPPLAAVLVLSALLARDGQAGAPASTPRARILPVVSWILGTAAGAAASDGLLTFTSLPTLDSILIAGVSFATIRFLEQRWRIRSTGLAVEPLF